MTEGVRAAPRRLGRRSASLAVAGLLALLLWWWLGTGTGIHRARAVAPGPVLVLAVDTAGSMVKNDPHNLRAAAVEDLAARLPATARLGIVGFAAKPTILLPPLSLGAPGAHASLAAAVRRIGASGATDILAAVDKGAALLGAVRGGSGRRVLILLTDGTLDPPGSALPARAAAYRSDLYTAAAGFARRGWVLDTIGLGGGVDAAELGRMAHLGGGTYTPLRNAAGLAQGLVQAWRATLARSRPPAGAHAAPPPKPVRLAAVPAAAPLLAGRTGRVALAVVNPGRHPVTVRLRAQDPPHGWALADRLIVPPGSARVFLRVRVGTPRRGARAATVRLTVRASAAAGVTLRPAVITWDVPVQVPGPTPWVPLGIAAAVAAALGFVGLGLVGYRSLVRPVTSGATLLVEDPEGRRLGAFTVPDSPAVVVGQAECRTAHLRLAWLPGEQVLFRLVGEGDVTGNRWLRGLRAWWSSPDAQWFAEAAWPFHLYPGPIPQRRVDLSAATSFGACGLTFTYRRRGQHRAGGGAGPGVDVLGDGGAEPGVDVLGDGGAERGSGGSGELGDSAHLGQLGGEG